MKKIKILCAYLVAILCVLSTLFYEPKKVEVFKTSTNESNQMMIYMLDNEKDLVPVTVRTLKKESHEENIGILFDLMKQDLNIHEFTNLIPKSIQLIDVDIQENVVKLDFNEALLAMNSQYELRFIEGIVSSIVQLNPDFKIEFYVNHEKINQMPLSQLPMIQFDSSLGVNNFELNHEQLHNSISRQVVQLKSNDQSEYFVVKTRRVSDEDILSFINDVIDETSLDLECLNVEENNDEWVLHVNEKFLIEENIIDKEKIMSLLYTLKMNQFADHFVIKVNDDVVRIDGFQNEKITFQDLNLNIFEE